MRFGFKALRLNLKCIKLASFKFYTDIQQIPTQQGDSFMFPSLLMHQYFQAYPSDVGLDSQLSENFVLVPLLVHYAEEHHVPRFERNEQPQ